MIGQKWRWHTLDAEETPTLVVKQYIHQLNTRAMCSRYLLPAHHCSIPSIVVTDNWHMHFLFFVCVRIYCDSLGVGRATSRPEMTLPDDIRVLIGPEMIIRPVWTKFPTPKTRAHNPCSLWRYIVRPGVARSSSVDGRMVGSRRGSSDSWSEWGW